MKTAEAITEINRAIRILESLNEDLAAEDDMFGVTPVVQPISLPIRGKRVAVCVGHSRPGDFGATACDGMTTEYAWNHKLAVELSEFLEAMGAKVLLLDYYGESTQTYLSYGQAMSWVADKVDLFRADVSIELHFNSAPFKEARGFETLVTGSERGQILGNALQDEMAHLFKGEPNRGVKTRSRNDRGSGFLYKCKPPAAILEPLFGSNPTSWNKWKNKRKEISEAYARGVRCYFEKTSN